MSEKNKTKLQAVCEKCGMLGITEELLEALAEDAADRAVNKVRERFFNGVGHLAINKLFSLIGMLIVAGASWMAAKGMFKWP